MCTSSGVQSFGFQCVNLAFAGCSLNPGTALKIPLVRSLPMDYIVFKALLYISPSEYRIRVNMYVANQLTAQTLTSVSASNVLVFVTGSCHFILCCLPRRCVEFSLISQVAGDVPVVEDHAQRRSLCGSSSLSVCQIVHILTFWAAHSH